METDQNHKNIACLSTLGPSGSFKPLQAPPRVSLIRCELQHWPPSQKLALRRLVYVGKLCKIIIRTHSLSTSAAQPLSRRGGVAKR